MMQRLRCRTKLGHRAAGTPVDHQRCKHPRLQHTAVVLHAHGTSAGKQAIHINTVENTSEPVT